MFIDNNLQREIIETIQTNSPTTNMTQIFKDLIEENQDRATTIYGLRQRGKLKSATVYSDFENGTNTGANKDGIPIFAREKLSEYKINHRLHNDYYNAIIQNKVGYIPEIMVNGDDTVEKFLKSIRYNTRYIEQISNMTGYGVAYLLAYNDTTGNLRLTNINADETIVIRNQSTNEIEYAMRYWKVKEKTNNQVAEKWRVEWYDKTSVKVYLEDGENSYIMINEYMHTFDRVPVFEFLNNTDGIGDCEYTINLQDAYDLALSDLSSEITQMRLAYLVLSNLGRDIDDELVKQLINTGLIAVGESGDAKFLEKNLNDTAVQNLLAVLDSNIWKFSNSYNPDALGSEQTAYEIRQKLKRLQDSVNETVMLYKDTFQEVLELIQSWYKKWKNININIDDITITIPYREPKNIEASLQAAVNAKARIATKTTFDILGLQVDVEANEKEWNREYGMTGMTNANQ